MRRCDVTCCFCCLRTNVLAFVAFQLTNTMTPNTPLILQVPVTSEGICASLTGLRKFRRKWRKPKTARLWRDVGTRSLDTTVCPREQLRNASSTMPRGPKVWIGALHAS